MADDTLGQHTLWTYTTAAIEAVEAAAEAAALSRTLREFSQGLSMRVGERGSKLSGGEKQRVEVARALRGAPLLLADEPTSSADAD